MAATASAATLALLIRETQAQSHGLRASVRETVNPSNAARRATTAIQRYPLTLFQSDLHARNQMRGVLQCQCHHQPSRGQKAATLARSQRHVSVPSHLDAMVTAMLPRVRHADPNRGQSRDPNLNLKPDRSRVHNHVPNRERSNRNRDLNREQNPDLSHVPNRDRSRALSPNLSRRSLRSQSLRRRVKMRLRDQRNAKMIGKPDGQ